MKLFVLFAVFGFLGTVLGDEETGGVVTTQNEDGGASSAITCLEIPENELERETQRGYVDIAVECMSIEKTGLDMENLTTIEECRQQASQYCLDVADIRNCLANVSKLSDTCQNQTQQQRFMIFVRMLESAIEVVCREDGNPLAVISYGIRTISQQEKVFGKCMDMVDYKKSSVGITEQERSAKILWLYRRIDMAKECFQSRLEEGELKNVIVLFMDEMRSRMNCVHPENQTTVLCSTIDHDED